MMAEAETISDQFKDAQRYPMRMLETILKNTREPGQVMFHTYTAEV